MERRCWADLQLLLRRQPQQEVSDPEFEEYKGKGHLLETRGAGGCGVSSRLWYLSAIAMPDQFTSVENLRPGALDRLNLGYDVLSETNPGIILASTSGPRLHSPHCQYMS